MEHRREKKNLQSSKPDYLAEFWRKSSSSHRDGNYVVWVRGEEKTDEAEIFLETFWFEARGERTSYK